MSTETPSKPKLSKPERDRQARNVDKGDQVNVLGTDEWLTVVQAFHLLAPVRVSRLEFDDGTAAALRPESKVRSRRLADSEGSN